MKSEDLLKGLEPVMKMAAEANIWSKTITRHYIKTIGELTGKTETELKSEIEKIQAEVQNEMIDKIKNNGSKS